MARKLYLNLILLINLNLLLTVSLVLGHGRMLDPPGRGSMWRFDFNVPPNYNDMTNNCGGISNLWEKNNGKCGVCGDPYEQEPKDHEPGGQYATGIIGKTYTEGEAINITIDITANHYGYFEFRLCKNDEFMKKVTQECFNENLLEIKNNNAEIVNAKSTDPNNKFKFFVPIKDKTAKFYVYAQLPNGVNCKYCVLQWKYHAENNFGKSENGKSCLGCSANQEEVYNCADIEIIPNNSRNLATESLILNTTTISTDKTLNNSSFKLISKFYIIQIIFVFIVLC